MKPKTCKTCGVEFLPSYRVAKAAWGKIRFCSRSCYHTYRTGRASPCRGRALKTLAERFWSKVDKDGPVPKHVLHLGPCWLWTGAVTGGGYGYLGNRRNPNVLAHRVSYEIHRAPVPAGLCVLHRCDNPPCVNPAHLFLGTRVDNNADKKAKGRECDRRGERNPRAKLTAEKVLLVKQLRAEGMSQQTIADRVGVSQVQISHILRGVAWKEVEF